MSSTLSAPAPKSDSAALEGAFTALRTYAEGSGRAALLPLDQAVAAAETSVPARRELEKRLLAELGRCTSNVAREYVCSKLALVGTDDSVPALARLLADVQLSTAARNALQAVPGSHATTALRDSIATLGGVQRVGAIHSLGYRRDDRSTRLLVRLLRDSDSGVAAAAVAALGEIGSPKAAKAIRAFQPLAPASLRPGVADAALVCAEHLLADGRSPEARTLFQFVASSAPAPHFQAAAARGLERCAR